MKWKKLGLIFEPKTVNRDWMVTHAMDPTVDHVKEDIYRIYFCGRNKDNQSLIGFVEIEINSSPHILLISSPPLLTIRTSSIPSKFKSTPLG